MQDFPLTVTHILRYGQQVYGRSEVQTFDGGAYRRTTFSELAARAEQLAAGLRRLGVGDGDRVGTLMWNTQEHMEVYFAVPCMGAVLHTLNLRLIPEQLGRIINTAEDKVLIVDETVLPLVMAMRPHLRTVEHIVVVGDARPEGLGTVIDYEELLAAEEPGYDWPELEERSAAAMCFTSGTTGEPKGVVYSHRSTFLHAMGSNAANAIGCTQRDRLLVIVPMFHVNAWGMPYTAWMAGADLVMPGRFLQPEPLCRQIALAKPTFSAGVPTIWAGVLQYGLAHPEVELSSLRTVTSGGSATPKSLIEAFEGRFGVRVLEGWGMTETSPICTISEPPKQFDAEDVDWKAKAGRIVPGVEVRIVSDEGKVQPRDGESLGEIEVRGPWITGSYYGGVDPDRFHDGWLRTGDIGTVDDYGFLQISDRAKDVIKSGGEWISSVDLESELMAHPAVAEASVVGVPDDRWQERPLAVVVLKAGNQATIEELLEHLTGRVAKWWLPERWTFVAEIPKTSVGKFDKKRLRAGYAAGELEVTEGKKG